MKYSCTCHVIKTTSKYIHNNNNNNHNYHNNNNNNNNIREFNVDETIKNKKKLLASFYIKTSGHVFAQHNAHSGSKICQILE